MSCGDVRCEEGVYFMYLPSRRVRSLDEWTDWYLKRNVALFDGCPITQKDLAADLRKLILTINLYIEVVKVDNVWQEVLTPGKKSNQYYAL